MARTAGSHSDITGPRIEQAALTLIARHGFAAVSMRQIAGEVGVQAGALYNYIPDKQTLLARLMVAHMTTLLDTSAELGRGNALERLRAFVLFHIVHVRDHADSVFVAYMELRNLSPENFAKIETMRQDYEARLQDILNAGVREGVFDVPNTRIATRALIAMLNGVNIWFREGGPLSLEAVQEIYWDMVRKSVSAE